MSDIIDRGTDEIVVRGTPLVESPREYALDASGPVVLGSSEFVIRHRGFAIATFAMVFISAITFWMPLFGALLAGAFGGFFAKHWGRGFAAAALASVLVTGFFGVFQALNYGRELRIFSGMGLGPWAVLNALGLFIGAAAGVYSRPLKERRGLTSFEPLEDR